VKWLLKTVNLGGGGAAHTVHVLLYCRRPLAFGVGHCFLVPILLCLGPSYPSHHHLLLLLLAIQSNRCNNAESDNWFVDHLGRIRPLLNPQLAITLVQEPGVTTARLRPLNAMNQTFANLGGYLVLLLFTF
jgi:hypothetical protein